ncbi:MAG: flavin reductase family protein [Anaerolineae bacterium]|nr:flavin reductase family protein [Anaerolineae bacterium]
MKVQLGAVPFVYPVPIALGGATVAGKPNYLTLGDVGIMGINPPLVYISSGTNHYTNQGILEHGTYSINFPTRELLAKVDYCGMVSGHDVDKSVLFETFYGELGTAPMIRECPVNLECRVVKEFSIQHRQVFVGEVVQAYVDAAFVTEEDGHVRFAELTELAPILYALDNRYYTLGPVIGRGYHEGKSLLEQNNKQE